MKITLDKKFFLTTFLLGFCGLVNIGMLLAQSETSTPQQSQPQNQYPQTVVDDYLKTCLTQSTKEGLTTEDSNRLCTCTINKFQSLYTLEQFNTLRVEAKTNQLAAEELSEVGYACFDEILYEN